MGKRPMMWSPLVWDPNAPPAALVDAEAILNLWTGDIKTLAFNITLKVRFWFVPEFRLILVILVRFQLSLLLKKNNVFTKSQENKVSQPVYCTTQPVEMTSSLLLKQNETVYMTS
jgi:hypothetical protein